MYVDNETDREQTVAVTVAFDSSQTPPFERRYRLPGHTRVRIANVGKLGELYQVSAVLDNDVKGKFTWRILDCEGSDGPEGNSDLEIDILGREIRFRKNECDLIAIEDDAPAENASRYEVTD